MAVSWRTDYQLYRKYLQEVTLLYQSRSDVRAFIEIILSSVAIFVFGAFAIRPTVVTIAGLNKEIESKKETVQVLDAKIDNLIAAEQLYESLRNEITILQSAVPTEPAPIILSQQIERVAAKNEVTISSFTIDRLNITGSSTQTETSEGSQNVSASINIVGTYSQLLGFLGDLSKMRRPMVQASTFLSLSDNDPTKPLSLTVIATIPFIGQ